MLKRIAVLLLAALLAAALGVSALGAGTEATIEGRLYATFTDALEAAKTGDVIRLQQDVRCDDFQISKKAVIVDVNGHVPELRGTVRSDAVLILQNCTEYIAEVACALRLWNDEGSVCFFGTRPGETEYISPVDSAGTVADNTVATVSHTAYADMARALKAAGSSTGISLRADWTFPETHALGHRAVINGNGHSLGNLSVEQGGMLILENGGAETDIRCARTYKMDGTAFYFGDLPVWDAERIIQARLESEETVPPVCVLDGLEYVRLDEALRDAIDGSQLTLLADCALDEAVAVTAVNVFFDAAGFSWSGTLEIDAGGILAIKEEERGAGEIRAALSYKAAGWTWYYGTVDSITLQGAEQAYTGEPIALSGAVVTALGQDISAHVAPVYSYYQDKRCTIPAVGSDPAQPPSEPGTYWVTASLRRYLSDPAALTILPPPEEEGETQAKRTGTLVPFLILVGVIVLAGAVIFLVKRFLRK